MEFRRAEVVGDGLDGAHLLQDGELAHVAVATFLNEGGHALKQIMLFVKKKVLKLSVFIYTWLNLIASKCAKKKKSKRTAVWKRSHSNRLHWPDRKRGSNKRSVRQSTRKNQTFFLNARVEVRENPQNKRVSPSKEFLNASSCVHTLIMLEHSHGSYQGFLL